MSEVHSSDHANIALLIDADNASPEAIDPVLTVLAGLGTVNIRRAYGNWQKHALNGWADIVHRHAIEPHQQFDVTKGKSATDMRMTIDAMDLLYKGRVHGFGIMSSDSDFMPLAMRIRQDGVPVYGFGTAQTPTSFQQACNRFIDVSALVAAKKAKAERKPVSAELASLLAEAYEASRRDEAGFATLSEVGQIVGNRDSFDVRSFGYKRLSELVEATPGFTTERRDGRVYVRRADAAA